MRAVTEERLKFEQYLKDAGLNLSKGRQAVFSEVMRTHGHFTAEELARTCSGHKPSVSRATVYRAIRELLEAGVIRETAFGDKHHHYEHVYDEKPHHHAQCVRCHTFTEFPDLHEDDIYKPILEKQGFKVLGHEMHFYGICSSCQNKSK
ncbi:MAG: transcriptional repressor [Candidatus Omnitrophica bacterium]|nr:transcriptional repressor [Candidatus Omnitrophota bacterium]